MKKEVFQLIYLLGWLVITIGMIGNAEVRAITPGAIKIIHSVLSFLVIGKFIYWIRKGELM